MSVGVRRALTTATAVVSCSAAVVLGASPAWAAHGRGVGTGWCDLGMLSYLPNGEPPVVTTTDATALGSGRLSNESAYDLTDVHAVLSVAPPAGSSALGGAGVPQLVWRVDGSSWHTVSLSWNGLSGPGAAWRSGNLDLGFSLAQRSSATVDLQTEFVSTSPGGEYVDQLTFTAQTCGSQTLGAGLNFADYQPAAGGSGGPGHPGGPGGGVTAPTTKKASAPAVKTSAKSTHRAESPAKPAASPSPSPSASASQLKVNFVQVLPSAQAVASSQSGENRVPDGVLAVVAVVFLGGLVGIRSVRKHKSS